MALERYKVKKVPAAFKDVAALHNSLVNLIGAMEGAGGIKVIVTDGKIVIEGAARGATSGGGLTWAEIKANILADGDIYDMAYNAAYDAIAVLGLEDGIADAAADAAAAYSLASSASSAASAAASAASAAASAASDAQSTADAVTATVAGFGSETLTTCDGSVTVLTP